MKIQFLNINKVICEEKGSKMINQQKVKDGILP